MATQFCSYWFLSEPVTAIQITGAELMLAGVALVTARRTWRTKRKTISP